MLGQGKHPSLEPSKHLGTLIQTKKANPYRMILGDKLVRYAKKDTTLDVTTPENIPSVSR
jgi:hypothetical protein